MIWGIFSTLVSARYVRFLFNKGIHPPGVGQLEIACGEHHQQQRSQPGAIHETNPPCEMCRTQLCTYYIYIYIQLYPYIYTYTHTHTCMLPKLCPTKIGSQHWTNFDPENKRSARRLINCRKTVSLKRTRFFNHL